MKQPLVEVWHVLADGPDGKKTHCVELTVHSTTGVLMLSPRGALALAASLTDAAGKAQLGDANAQGRSS